jgi:radical SAM protein with 4Fe4S-binding SPASM domain
MKIEADSHKLDKHPERVAEWRQTGDCFPIYVEIGLTNRCNHNCMFCALDYLEHGGADIDSKILSKNLENMAKHGVKSVMFAGEGEPFLHKNIPFFVRTAKESGMDVSITSNGVPFTDKKAEQCMPYLSWIRFSVDAGTPETYAKIHGTKKGDFEKVLNNIKYAVNLKSKNNLNTTIGVQALLTNKSLDELSLLARTIKNIGVDNLQIKPYSHHPASKNDLRFDYNEAEKLRVELEGLNNQNFQVIYRTQTIKRLFQERDYKECYGLPFFTLIDSKGNVLPCNLFYNNQEFSYGNLYKNSFSEIWNGEKRKKVIQNIKSGGINDCRLGCRLDASNRYLERLKNPHPHDNFI